LREKEGGGEGGERERETEIHSNCNNNNNNNNEQVRLEAVSNSVWTCRATKHIYFGEEAKLVICINGT